MPVVPQIQLTGTLTDLFGVPLVMSSLAVQLCNYGSQVPRINGTSIIAQTAPIEIDCPAGTFAFSLWGNDVIFPGGTYYVFQVLDDNGNVIQTNAYQFAGALVADLSTVAPFNPNVVVVPVAPTILSGLVVLVYNANMVIDASLGNAFELTLTGDVGAATFNNVQPGKVYTFILIQDGVGNRVFTWPGNILGGPGPINVAAGSTTTQSFVARANGNLYPTGPAIYS